MINLYQHFTALKLIVLVIFYELFQELTQFNSNPGTSSNPSNPIQPGNVRLWNEIRLPDEIAKGTFLQIYFFDLA